MFDHYESEYLSTSKAAMQDIELVDQLLPGLERDTISKRITAAISSAEEIVQSMELEARSMTGESKQQLIAQAKDYKTGIADMRARLRKALTSNSAEVAARSELLRKADPTLRLEADNQRSRLMATTERLGKTSDALRGAVAVALETEQVGESILSDLNDQRATIAHARGTLAGASAGLDRSKRLLHGMTRRALKNKVLMYVIIFALSAMILTICYCARLAHASIVPGPYASPASCVPRPCHARAAEVCARPGERPHSLMRLRACSHVLTLLCLPSRACSPARLEQSNSSILRHRQARLLRLRCCCRRRMLQSTSESCASRLTRHPMRTAQRGRAQRAPLAPLCNARKLSASLPVGVGID